MTTVAFLVLSIGLGACAAAGETSAPPSIDSGSPGLETAPGNDSIGGVTYSRYAPAEVPLAALARHTTFSAKGLGDPTDFVVYSKGLPAAEVVVGYLKPSLAPASRGVYCGAPVNVGALAAPSSSFFTSVRVRGECMDSWLLDEAADTLVKTLQSAVCRSELGACPDRLSVRGEGSPSRRLRFEIHIGWTAEARAALAGSVPSLDRHGYGLFSQRGSDGVTRLFIVGGTSYGTMFGVAGLLSDWVGAAWLFPGTPGESIPLAPQSTERLSSTANMSLTLHRVNALEEPDYRQRGLSGVGDGARGERSNEEILEHRRYVLRNRLEPHNQLAMLWDNAWRNVYHLPDNANESRINWGHAPLMHLNAAEQGYAHSEWFPQYRWYPSPDKNNQYLPVGDPVRDAFTGRSYPPSLAGFTGSFMHPYDVVYKKDEGFRYLPSTLTFSTGLLPNPATLGQLDEWRTRSIGGGYNNWKPCFYGAQGLRHDLIDHTRAQLMSFTTLFPWRQGESFAPTDGGGHCQCVACRAKTSPASGWVNPFNVDTSNTLGVRRSGASYSRRYLEATNAVARGVAPSQLVTTYAYTNYIAPPPDEDLLPGAEPHQGPIDLEPNVLVYIAQSLDREEFGLPAALVGAGPMRRNVERWGSVVGAEQLGYYDYIQSADFVVPRVYTARLQSALKHGYQNKVRAYVAEVFPSFVYESQQLYALSRLLWNVDTNPSALQEQWVASMARGVPQSGQQSLLSLVRTLESSWTTYDRTRVRHRTWQEPAISDTGVLTYGGFASFAEGSPWQLCALAPTAAAQRVQVAALARSCEGNMTPGCSRVRTLAAFWDLSFRLAAHVDTEATWRSAFSAALALGDSSWGATRTIAPRVLRVPDSGAERIVVQRGLQALASSACW